MDKFCKHGQHIKFCPECANEWAGDQAPHALMNSMDPPRDKLVGVVKDELGIVSISPFKHDPSLARIDSKVRMVHVNGHLFLWALEYIIKHGPNVKVIQIQPRRVHKITDSHRKRCREAGIRLITGLIKPERAWEPGEARRSDRYKACKKFFELLQDEQRKLFDDLPGFGFDESLMVREYYGEERAPLCDETEDDEPVFLRTLAARYGFKSISYITNLMSAVMHYLDPNFKVTDRAVEMARVMYEKVERLRRTFQTQNARAEKARSLGLSMLPPGMWLTLIEDLEIVVNAKRRGWLADLAKAKPRAHRALTLRFDIRDPSAPRFRTLEETAEAMEDGFKTRECTRQIIEQAFEYLVMRQKASIDKLSGHRLEHRTERTVARAQKRTAKKGPVTALAKVSGALEKQVMALVCQLYDLDEETLRINVKTQPNAEAGQVVMYLWRKYLNWSYRRIARKMDDGDTVIIYGCERIAKRRKEDQALEQRLSLIEMMLGKPPPPLT